MSWRGWLLAALFAVLAALLFTVPWGGEMLNRPQFSSDVAGWEEDSVKYPWQWWATARACTSSAQAGVRSASRSNWQPAIRPATEFHQAATEIMLNGPGTLLGNEFCRGANGAMGRFAAIDVA